MHLRRQLSGLHKPTSLHGGYLTGGGLGTCRLKRAPDDRCTINTGSLTVDTPPRKSASIDKDLVSFYRRCFKA